MDLGFLILELNQYQIYGLFFLLGSLVVATISDLKKLAAQKEFLQFWATFAVGMFLLDLYPMVQSGSFSTVFILKWVSIVALCVLSYSDRGVIFKLSGMDVAAIAAVLSIFNIYSILIFFPLLKIISLLEKPLLRRSGRYPFIPVIFTTVALILGLNLVLLS